MTLERQNKRSQKGLICVIKKKKERKRKKIMAFILKVLGELRYMKQKQK